MNSKKPEEKQSSLLVKSDLNSSQFQKIFCLLIIISALFC